MELAIDLGTANVLVCVRGKGVVLREPSIVAMEQDTKRVLAIGEEARKMLGRTPEGVIASRPLQDGVVADYETTQAMIRYFIEKVAPRGAFSRPRVMLCVPTSATGSERRAVLEAALAAGAGKVEVIDEALAAALGLGLDLRRARGNLVVDIGGGTSDAALLCLGGTHAAKSVRVAGDAMDRAIVAEVRERYDLSIGHRAAEELKMSIGTLHPDCGGRSAKVRGRDASTGLPQTYAVTGEDLRGALEATCLGILGAVKEVLEISAPELVADIADGGIWLTGGGALLHGLPQWMAEQTGVSTQLAEDCLSTVAFGALRALEAKVHGDHLELFRRVI